MWESGRGGPETGWRLWRTGYILGHSAFAVRVRTIACHDPCVRPLLLVMALAWKYRAGRSLEQGLLSLWVRGLGVRGAALRDSDARMIHLDSSVKGMLHVLRQRIALQMM